jgi:imidazolonepropionase-like amidohydrolase
MKLKTRRHLASAAAAIAVTLTTATASAAGPSPVIINAGMVFNGTDFVGPQSVLVQNGKIARIGTMGSIKLKGAKVINMPNGSLLPGFIDMHTHHLINNVPVRRMMEHGVTTARDLGSAEPNMPFPANQPYQLRQFYSGPILQAPGGYPNSVFPGSGIEVSGIDAVKAKVDDLVLKGATAIAVSLEIGGEHGAPWGWHEALFPVPWATLSDAELAAAVDEAHLKGVKVTAYLGNEDSARRSLVAGVDEWAHSPCDSLSDQFFADYGNLSSLAVDGTLDTEVACLGALDNAAKLVHAGAKLFYSTDMGHLDIPHGIDANEVHLGLHVGFHTGKDYPTALAAALASATREGGQYLGLAPLGQIAVGAPADLIVISTNVMANFKELEFPRYVLKDGAIVVERSTGQ